MSRCLMIREPEVVHRATGFPRWAVEWALYDPETMRSSTRCKHFLTRRRAERWIESKRIKPEQRWEPADLPVADAGTSNEEERS